MGEIEKIQYIYIYIYFTRDEFRLSFFFFFSLSRQKLHPRLPCILFPFSFFFLRDRLTRFEQIHALVRRMGGTNAATVSNATVSNATVRIPRRRRVEKKERMPSAIAVRVYSNGRFHRCQYPILTLRSQHANDPRTSPPPAAAAAERHHE